MDTVETIVDLLDTNWDTSNVAKPLLKPYWEARITNVGNATYVMVYEIRTDYDYTTIDLGLRDTTVYLTVDILTNNRSTMTKTADEIRRILESTKFNIGSTWYYALLEGRRDLSDKDKPLFRLVLDVTLIAMAQSTA